MEELIELATTQLGIDSTQARAATGGLMSILSSQLPDGDFAELAQAIPGAAEAQQSEPGGVLGGLTDSLGGMLGGGSADALGGLAQLASSGLGAEKTQPFVQLAMNFIQSKAGAALVQKILAGVPEISKFVNQS